MFGEIGPKLQQSLLNWLKVKRAQSWFGSSAASTAASFNTTALPVPLGGTGLTSTTANDILFSSSASVIGQISTANSGMLVTSSAGVPSILAPGNGAIITFSSGTASAITNVAGGVLVGGTSIPAMCAAGTAGQVLTSNGTSPATFQAAAGGSSGSTWNFIINGQGVVSQRGSANYGSPYNMGVASGSYFADRWVALTSSGAADLRGDAQNGISSYFGICASNHNSSAQRVGMMQILDSLDVLPNLRGQQVTFSVGVATDAAVNCRIAILENIGTIDSINFGTTGDASNRSPVGSWTSTTFTKGNFFKNSANLNVDIVSASTATTNAAYTTISVTATLSASVNNVLVMVWTDATMNEYNGIYVTNASLVLGSSAPSVYPARSVAQEVSLCQRYFYSSYDSYYTGIGGAFTAGCVGAVTTKALAASTAGTLYLPIRVPQQMRSYITNSEPVYTFYSPVSGLSGCIRDLTAGADITNCTAYQPGCNGATGASVSASNTQAIAALDQLEFHFTVEAEI